MHSAGTSAAGREDGDNDELQLSTDADRLLTEHGQDAGQVAAHQADTLFLDGDVQGGARWLKIFRRIALAHRRRAVD